MEPGTPIVGVWIALDEATPENGCLHFRPGSHREGALVHFRRRDWQLCDADVIADHAVGPGRDVMVPLPPGGAIFFDGLVHLGTPANRTATRRRALQLHFHPASAVRTTEERRMEIFGSEGKDVTC
ncbi:phytanoyl-CoA dioxygenase family protein [Pseudonocardia kunmingensis]|uniref:phytanoyl-CoA dioxygenase family protein n=1 Tax=Pseudonocardia kunmingensis TaxID=630975 RepID=UPI001150F865|nr:phytanoyl-CoA dioxygenase family protein [Pseudonocardia kunmingensis]